MFAAREAMPPMNVTDRDFGCAEGAARDSTTWSTSERWRSSIAGSAPPSSSGGAGSCGGCCSLADLIGLLSAFLLAVWLAPARQRRRLFTAAGEFSRFLLTLPAWVVITKLYGLYDHDDERANHSTADDFGGVFHMVTVCAWLVTRRRVRERCRASERAEARDLLGLRNRVRLRRPRRGEDACTAERGLYPEHGHSRCGRRRTAGCEEAP